MYFNIVGFYSVICINVSKSESRVSLAREGNTMKYHHSLLEWPKAKKLTIPNADKDVEQEFSFVSSRMQNGTATLEDSLSVSYKTKHTPSRWPSNFAPWYSPKGFEKLCLHNNMQMIVYISFVHNCQHLEATICPLAGEWIYKVWYIHTMGYYSTLKRKELSSHEKTWEQS